MKTVLYTIAIIILIINITLTILEARIYYHATFHAGRNRGESGAHEHGAGDPDVVRIGGMCYNVRWIIKQWEGVITLEEE